MRWKGFITLVVIAAVVFVIGIFFLDNIIESAIEKAVTAAWGAKVEVKKVNVKWSPLGVEILGLTVASKKDEYKNLIEIKNINLSVLIAPLLEKKLVIREASGKELAFNTKRKTSGFLAEEEREKREKIEKKWEASMSSWMENIKKRGKEKIDVAGAFKKEELQSLKAVKEVERSFGDLKGKYREFKGLNVDETVNLIIEKTKALDGISIKDAEDIEKAKEKIEEAQGAIKQADKLKRDINNTVKEFENSVSDLKGKIKNIDEARKADYKSIMKKLKLPSIEMEDIAETVFGPLVTEKFKTIVSYVEKVRKYIPPKEKKEEITRKPRKQGDDIIFTRKRAYPALHVMKALISGENDASIELKDFTPTPWVIGRPVIINATYYLDRFSAIIHRTTEDPSEDFRAILNNFKVAGSAGVLGIAANFRSKKVNSEINWRGRGILPPDWLEYLKLKDPVVTLTVKVYGEKDSLKFSMESNLDKIISNQLKKELAKKMEEAKKKVNGLVDSEVLGRKQKIESDINSFKSRKVAYLNKEKEKVEDKKKELNDKVEAKKKEAEELLEKKKKEAEELLEKKKKEEEEKLKKEAEDKLKKESDKLKKLFK